MSRSIAIALAAVLLISSAGRAGAASYFSQGGLSPNLVTSWNSDRGGAGAAPADFASSDTFVVQTGHAMATTAAWAVSGASAALQIENGGSLTANHLVSVPAFQLDGDATYVHNAASGTANGAATDLPGTTRALAPTSTVEIRRWANGGTAPVALPNLEWGNLTINVASIGGDWPQGANLRTVHGDLAVMATGSSGREFRLTGGGTRAVDILGNYSQSGGHVSFSGVAGTINVSVSGDFTLSGGIFSTAEGVSVISTLNLFGDFSHTGGTLTENGNQGGMIVFKGGDVQNFTTGGVVTQTIGWQVSTGATLSLGTHTVTGGGTFTLQPGAGLVIGSPAGISASSASGNVQTAGSRSFSTTADYTYSGTAAQITGTGLPANVRHLDIDNPAGVTLTNGVAVNGTLSLASGALAVGSKTLTLNDAVVSSGGTITSAATGSVAYNSAAAGQNVVAGSYGNLTFNSAAKSLAPAGTIAVAGVFAPGSATDHAVEGSTIQFNGAGAQTIPAFRYANLSSADTGARTLASGGAIRIGGVFTPGSNAYGFAGSTVIYDGWAPQSLPVGFAAYDHLTLDNPAGVTLGGDVTVDGVLNLAQGTVATGPGVLTVGPAGSVSRTSGHVTGFLSKPIAAGTSTTPFEVGTNLGYTPVALSFRDVTIAGLMTVSSADGDHPGLATSGIDPARSVNRAWSLTPDGLVYDEYDVTLSFLPGDLDAGVDTADLQLQTYDAPHWTAAEAGTLTATSVQGRRLKSFSDFAVGALKVHTLAASAGPNGTIAPSGAIAVKDGSSQAFTITPDGHHHIADVAVDGVSVGPVTRYEFLDVKASHTLEATFGLTVHAIAATAGPNGSIDPSGSVGVADGSDRTFTITPDPHFHVLDVRVDDVSVGAVTVHTFTSVTGDHAIAATFAIDTWTITATAGANGAIDPAGAVRVEHGADRVFTITPDPHHHVLDVRVDGVSVGAVAEYTFTNVTGDHGIAASFAITTHTITAAAGPNGSIAPAGTTIVEDGAEQTFLITPDPNYHVLDVRVDGVSVDTVTAYTFTNVTADHTLGATFAIDTYPITALAGPGGTTAPAGVTLVPAGGTQGFDIAADPGHYLVEVRVDGAPIGKPAHHEFTGVLAAHTLEAMFAPNDSLTALLALRAAQASGSAPHGAPGAESPWTDLIGTHDAALVGFAGTLASGWKGDGTPASPHRLHYSGEEVAVVGDTIPALQDLDPITAELWFRTGHDGPSANREYLLEWVASGGGGMSIAIAQGQVQLDLGGWTDVAPVAPASWHHVAVAKEPGAVRVYLDGVRVHTGAAPYLGVQSTPIAIGASSNSFAQGSPVHTGFFRGDVAEVTIWRGAMGDARALAVFEAGQAFFLAPSPPPAMCVVAIRADQADGAGPYPRPGASGPWMDLTAAPSPAALHNFDGSDSSGWMGIGTPGSPYRLRFDGIDDVVAIDPDSVPELAIAEAVTAELWFNPTVDTPAGEREYLIEWLQGFGRTLGMAVAIEDGQVAIHLNRLGWIAIGAAPAGQWTHLVVTKAPGEVHAYLNGLPAYSGTFPGFGEPGSEIVLGASTWRGPGVYGDHFTGSIAQARLHRGARSAQDAADVHAADAGLYIGVLATPEPPRSLALSGARPNPARGGRLDIAFSLPDDGPATIELIDVAGRRVTTRDVGALGPGHHAVQLGAGTRLAPGLYMIRLRHGGRALTAKAMVVR